MGLQNRDYVRRDRPVEGWTPAVKWLVGVQVVAYLVAFVATRVSGGPTAETVESVLALSPRGALEGSRLWQLLTYALLHDLRNPFHVILNGYLVWVAGRDLEEAFGSWRLVRFYVGTVLATGLVYVLAAVFAKDLPPLVGASAPAIALLLVHATRFAPERILVFLIFEVPVWIGVAIMAGIDLAMVAESRPNGAVAAGSVAAGAALAFGAQALRARADDAGWLEGPRARFGSIFRRKPPLRVLEGGRGREAPPKAVAATEDAPAHAAPPAMGATRRLELELDQVLQKISEQGMASLTSQERGVLDRASQLYRGDATTGATTGGATTGGATAGGATGDRPGR